MSIDSGQRSALASLLASPDPEPARLLLERWGYPPPDRWLWTCTATAARRLWPQNVTAARLAWVGLSLRADLPEHDSAPLYWHEGSHYQAVLHRGYYARAAVSRLAGQLPEADPRLRYLRQVGGLRPDRGLVNPLPPAVRLGLVELLTGEADPARWLHPG